jgi:hypothetical protein
VLFNESLYVYQMHLPSSSPSVTATAARALVAGAPKKTLASATIVKVRSRYLHMHLKTAKQKRMSVMLTGKPPILAHVTALD